MSGYFSRLIQQTGIALKTGEVSYGVNLPNPILPIEEAGKVGEALEVGEIRKQEDKEDEFQSTQGVENKDISASLPFPNQDAANRNYPPLPVIEREASLPIVQAQKPTILEDQVELSSESMPSSQDASAALSFPNPPKHPKTESEKLLESSTNVIQKIQQATETSLPEHSVQSKERDTPRESLRARLPAAIPKESNPLPTRKVNLQPVREWVAGVPRAGEMEMISEERGTQNSLIDYSSFIVPSLVSPIQNPPSKIQNPQPQETQNFVLSIGTISLTVEAPQPEVQKPPPMKSRQEVKPASQTSRLNRHYIRLR